MSFVSRCPYAVIALVTLFVSAGQLHAQRIQWTHLSTVTGDIPAAPGGQEQTACQVGDLNNDGLNDFIIEQRKVAPAAIGYLRNATGWDRIILDDTLEETSAGGTLYDVDNDGDLDVFLGQDFSGGRVWWLENPHPLIDPLVPWTKRVIKTGPGDENHNMDFADVDGDGADEFVVVCARSLFVRIYDIPADPKIGLPWPSFVDVALPVPPPLGEGLAIDDFNLDGKPDIVSAGYWLQHLGGTTYVPVAIDASRYIATFAFGDFVEGGPPELIVSDGESFGPLDIYIYDGVGSWTKRTILDGILNGHTLEIGDIDKNGHLDIYIGEMGDPGAGPDARSWVCWGDGQGFFDVELIQTGLANHESKLADLDGDGDLDFLIKPHKFGSPRIDIFMNEIVPLSLNAWTTHLIDAAPPYQAFFVDGGDVDGDGLHDVVAGGWWYKNPGTITDPWVRNDLGAPFDNFLLMRDFDGDGDLDCFGTVGQIPFAQSYGSLYLATNDGLGSFTITPNGISQAGTAGNGHGNSFVQGAAYGPFSPGGPAQVVLSWQEGEFGFSGVEIATMGVNAGQIPTIHPSSLGEGLSTGDIDGDGDLDIFQGLQWLRNEGATWTLFPTAAALADGGPDRNRLVDMDGDGDLDALVGPSHFVAPTAPLTWFENPADPTQLWPEHVIDPSIGGGFSLDVGDMDRDGDIDVILGEHVGETRLILYENLGGALTWQTRIIHPGGPGIDHHEGSRLHDIDNDGDLDILSIGWTNDKVWIFENLSAGLGNPLEAPDAPMNLTATGSAGNVVALDWDDNSESDLAWYQVFRSTTPGINTLTETPIASVVLASQFSDFDVEEGMTYYYAVTATDTNGNQSLASNEAMATTPADTTPPFISSAQAQGANAVQVVFTEGVDPTTAQLTGNYTLANGGPVTITTATLGGDGRTVTLATTLLTDATSYQLQVAGVLDLAAVPQPCNDTMTFLSDLGAVSGSVLLAHWDFEEGMGGTATDVSGNGHNGTVDGAEWTMGAENEADGSNYTLQFDGTNDLVNVPNFDVTGNAITLACWLRPSSFTTHDARLISQSTGIFTNDHNFMLSTIETAGEMRIRGRLKINGNTETIVASAGPLFIGQWAHAAFVYDGAEARLYLDGALVAAVPWSGPMTPVPGIPIGIGANAAGTDGKNFHGRMDDVRIYAGALSGAEIDALVTGSTAPPMAAPDSYTILEDTLLSTDLSNGVLANDVDSDGDTLIPVILTNVASGVLNLNLDGTFTYMPNMGFTGIDTFVYQAFDGMFESAAVTVSIEVNEPLDCNTNGIPDSFDIFNGDSLDCNENGIPDECDVALLDCNMNGIPDDCEPDCDDNNVPDDCDITGDPSRDCDTNGELDSCQIADGAADCDNNGVLDTCDIASGTQLDCNTNGIPDGCETDCNMNGVPDDCDITAGTSLDCNSNGIPDSCEADCNTNGVPDDCDIAAGTSDDCNGNMIPDECDSASGFSLDCDNNGVLDDCDILAGTATDCNVNGVPDECDLTAGTSADVNGNDIPDECDIDCNTNGIGDEFDIALGTSQDCNGNDIPDECDISSGFSLDCDLNGVPDDCDIAAGTHTDCDTNSIPDVCDIAAGGTDCDLNGQLDSCELAAGTAFDCDANGTLDVCDIAAGAQDCNFNGMPDVCEPDCDGNGLPDDCEVQIDCNNNGVLDNCDILGGAPDVNLNGIPDECETGIRGHWRFEEGSGGTVLDSSGDGNVGTIDGASWTDQTADGTDNALNFDGVNDVVSLGNFGVTGDELTLALWFRADDFAVSDARFLAKAFGVQEQEHIWMLSTVPKSGQNRLRFRLKANGFTTTLVANNGPLFPGNWYHAAAVYDGAGMKLYLNGGEVGFAFKNGSINDDPSVGAAIGNQPGGAGSRPFDGDIDDVRIYDKALTAAEVFELATLSFADCNNNSNPDAEDIQTGNSTDCNGNMVPDECDLLTGSLDCNENNIPDECEPDCNENGVADDCELAAGTSMDSNDNGIPDECELDCNGNMVPDQTDIALGTSLDCNRNGVPDECDIEEGTSTDCNGDMIPDDCQPDCDGNNVPDDCDLAAGTHFDCNGNDIPDVCDIASGFEDDCNGNSIPDDCELAAGTAFDCNGNMILDECDLMAGTSGDCNSNMVPDECDLVSGFSADCNTNAIPDDCETDCNGNNIPDDCDLTSGFAQDCNTNNVPDSCDIATGLSMDCNTDMVPDECQDDCNNNGAHDSCDIASGAELDCNGNGVPDSCEIASGAALDCNGNGVPDSCDLTAGTSLDCNGNMIPDSCDIASGFSVDCNTNGVPDDCDLTAGDSLDCNSNMVPDECDISAGTSFDCNTNGVPDSCDITAGTSFDCNTNMVPDECDLSAGTSPDCNANNIPDECDITAGTSDDCDTNGEPDECQPDCNNNGEPDTCDVLMGLGTDCNNNGALDECDLTSGDSLDCNGNMIPDECDISAGTSEDCNTNGIPDSCDLLAATSMDVDMNNIPDECQVDCNTNMTPDSVDISSGTSQDCNTNGVPDECDIAAGDSMDCNTNGIPDECEPDCDTNGVPDDCEIAAGAADCNSNGIPDTCDISSGSSTDCNTNTIPDDCEPDCDNNGVPDECEITAGAADCNSNGVPDSCDITLGTSMDVDGNLVPDDCQADCNMNMVPDDFELLMGTSFDCNTNNVPDECDTASGTSLDCNVNMVPDECEADCDNDGVPDDCAISAGAPDCNSNGIPDSCEITAGTSDDCNLNQIPDECEADCDNDGVPNVCEIAAGAPDCNGNAIPDSCDIALGISTDIGGNGVPDECEGFVAHWPLDEGVGTIAEDVSPNSFDGSISGALWSQDTNDGSPNCLEFDGVDDGVELGVIDFAGSEMSIAAWFWVDDFDVKDGRIISKATSPSSSDHYWMVSTMSVPGGHALRFRLKAGGTTTTLLPAADLLATGEWIHVVATYDGAEMKLYKNGIEIASTAKAGAISTNASVPVAIGNQPAGSPKPFDGRVDDVRLYERVLTGPEITQLSQASFPDCNLNLIDDAIDLLSGTSQDCNTNGTPDECDLLSGSSMDCNTNSIPDECEIDCNNNGTPDDCDVMAGSSLDCNSNGIPDECEPDCNTNGVPDDCDVTAGTSPDCNMNGIPDSCDIASGAELDCNMNGVPDPCDLTAGTSEDCNTNNIPDECDVMAGTTPDCNMNGIPDSCDIADGTEIDCDGNLVPDSCDIAAGASDCDSNGELDSCQLLAGGVDCNTNGVLDSCDIAAGTSLDVGGNGVPDECEVDCNMNGTFDPLDIIAGTSLDCNLNGVPDECDVAAGDALDCDSNGVPDECDPDCDNDNIPDACEILAGALDCNMNGVPDDCDIANGTSLDCNGTGIPDECELVGNDCNNNMIPDDCDLTSDFSLDCNTNNVPDECDVTAGTSLDCNTNMLPDECEVDCNTNNLPDDCDIAAGTSMDCDMNGTPDECDVVLLDCNTNGVPDSCDIASGTSLDCNSNMIPDDCELDCNSNGVPDDCDLLAGVPDCNMNGVPDSCDLAAGASVDLNMDTIPDECQADADLVGHWAFETGVGGTAFDSTDNQYDGAVQGASWSGTTTDGTTGSMSFDGFDDRVTLPNLDVVGTELTICAWVFPDDFGTADARIISKTTGRFEDDHYWMLSTIIAGGQIRPRFRLKAGGFTSTLIPASGGISAGTWTHLAVTYDGSLMKIFINAVEVAAMGKSGPIATGSSVGVAIGNQPIGMTGRPFDGLIDDVRIYEASLDATQIAEIQSGNTAPVAVADSYDAIFETPLSVGAAAGVLSNDSDIDLDPLTAIIETSVPMGTLSLAPDGSFNFQPPAGFSGPLTFTYHAFDGVLMSPLATVTINVSADPNAPATDDDSYIAILDSLLSVDVANGVLDNDNDPNMLSLTAVVEDGPQHGVLNLAPNGSFTYQPNRGYLGDDSFTYRATNGMQQSLPATVSLSVIEDPNMPVADDDYYEGDQDTMLVVSFLDGVLDNDTDPNFDPLTAQLVDDVEYGTLSLGSNGSFTYTPSAGFWGTDTFTYQAFDGGITSQIAQATIVVKQTVGTGYQVAPAPGSIYKEFTRFMSTDTSEWRVTDPDAGFINMDDPSNSPAAFLPNAMLPLTINDLTGAVRAEAIIDQWGGHLGTTGKGFTINGGAVIPIPSLPTTPGSPECYAYQSVVTVEVPLGDLVVGSNTLQGVADQQLPCFFYDWGQWGWYAVTIRVYYDETKPHPTGEITSPTAGATFDEDPLVTCNASSAVGIDKVEFYAYYDGYDIDGDGRYLDYHYNRHALRDPDSIEPRDHVGTDNAAPFAITWDTECVPDQAPGIVRLIARIKDTNGVWYVTPEVMGLTLERSLHEVLLCKPTNVPQGYWSNLNNVKSSDFIVPVGKLINIESAKLLATTWNGIDGGREPGETNLRLLNSHIVPEYGDDHFFSFDVVDIPTNELLEGTNTYSVNCQTIHHGIEMLWPGPGVLIRRQINVQPPAAPTGLGATNPSAGVVSLDWNDSPELSVATYNVYQGNAPGFPVDMTTQIASGLTTSEHTVSGLAEGSTFYYVVTAVTSGGLPSAPSAEVSVMTAVDMTAPSLLTATALGAMQVVCVFDEVVDQGTAENPANYAIVDGGAGVAVIAALLGGDGVTVTLTTGTLSSGVSYTLNAVGVLDLASSPNASSTNTAFVFTGGLIAHFPCEEGSGSTTDDLQGGPDANLVGPTWIGSSGDGSVASLNYDGFDDRLDIGAIEVDGAGFSAAMWCKPDAFGVGDARLISKGVGVTDQDHYWMISTLLVSGEYRIRFRLKTLGNTTTLVASAGGLTAGAWAHIACTYDGTQMQIYVNGVLVGATLKSGNVDAGPGILASVGNQPPGAGSRPFDGQIDDVRIYGRDLTFTEIQDLAQTGVMGATGAAPTIDLWYGPTLRFGHLGETQSYVNVLGNVSDADGIVSLTYSLNGGAAIGLGIGPDTRRLQNPGDFNIDILYSSLIPGPVANTVSVVAEDAVGNFTTEMVTLDYTSGVPWPASYTVDWDSAAELQDICQVVDGLWDVQSGKLVSVERGYDRLVAVGDVTHDNYEVTVPLTVQSVDVAPGFTPTSAGPLVGIGLRWPGHSIASLDPFFGPGPLQPNWGYFPAGGFCWYHWTDAGNLANGEFEITENFFGGSDTAAETFLFGQEYVFKARVTTNPDTSPKLQFKRWRPAVESEPAAWLLEQDGMAGDPTNGSVLLIAHHAEVAFGDVTVTALP